MSRGRLIFPMNCDIARLDTVATSAASGYDDDFREVKLADGDADGIGESQRVEQATLTVKAQIETDRNELQRMTGLGDVPDVSIGLVLHMRDVEQASLVDANGRVGIKKGDRLLEVRNKDGTVALKFDGVEDRSKVYCTHASRLNGFIGGTSNLMLLLFTERPQGRT